MSGRTNRLQIRLLIQTLDDLFTTNVLTLNNDTLNRHLTIKGLWSETYGALTVYNRWGQQIYQNHQYKNDWPVDQENIPLKPTTIPGLTEIVLPEGMA